MAIHYAGMGALIVFFVVEFFARINFFGLRLPFFARRNFVKQIVPAYIVENEKIFHFHFPVKYRIVAPEHKGVVGNVRAYSEPVVGVKPLPVGRAVIVKLGDGQPLLHMFV